MREVSAIKAIVGFICAAVITFVQLHSLEVGVITLDSYAWSLAAIGISMLFIKSVRTKLWARIIDLQLPLLAKFAFTISYALALGRNAFDLGSNDVLEFRISIAVVALIMAATEYGIGAIVGKGQEATELNQVAIRERRISAGISILAAIVFALSPLDALNAVGFFGAYLMILSLNYALIAAGPKQPKQPRVKTN